MEIQINAKSPQRGEISVAFIKTINSKPMPSAWQAQRGDIQSAAIILKIIY
jgi:hypothetical protein